MADPIETPVCPSLQHVLDTADQLHAPPAVVVGALVELRHNVSRLMATAINEGQETAYAHASVWAEQIETALSVYRLIEGEPG